LFEPLAAKAVSKGKLNFISVGEKFKQQLKELMVKLEQTNSVFFFPFLPFLFFEFIPSQKINK